MGWALSGKEKNVQTNPSAIVEEDNDKKRPTIKCHTLKSLEARRICGPTREVHDPNLGAIPHPEISRYMDVVALITDIRPCTPESIMSAHYQCSDLPTQPRNIIPLASARHVYGVLLDTSHEREMHAF